MKKIFFVWTLVSIIFICSCTENSDIGIIGGADGPTAILVGESVITSGKAE